MQHLNTLYRELVDNIRVEGKKLKLAQPSGKMAILFVDIVLLFWHAYRECSREYGKKR